MAFNVTEKLNNADKLVLQLTGTSNDGPGAKYWYNENYGWAPVIPPSKLWKDFNSIPSAANVVEAENALTTHPTLVERRVVRLTLDPTSNNRAYVAHTIFENATTPVLSNFIQPALIRTPAGDASWGYNVRLYNGDPLSGGSELSAIFEANAGDPSWSFNYSAGILVCSTDKSSIFKSLYDSGGLYIVGYRYIGEYLTSGGSSSTIIRESIYGRNVQSGYFCPGIRMHSSMKYILYQNLTLSSITYSSSNTSSKVLHIIKNDTIIESIDLSSALNKHTSLSIPLIPSDTLQLLCEGAGGPIKELSATITLSQE